jgi:hypothetical protein
MPCSNLGEPYSKMVTTSFGTPVQLLSGYRSTKGKVLRIANKRLFTTSFAGG